MARSRRIGPIDMTDTIHAILMEYGAEVDAVLEDAVLETGVNALHKLRRVQKFSPLGHPTGAYSASWTIERIASTRFGCYYAIHNENHYQLAHLLEFGHSLERGGRKIGDVPGYSHIKDVNDAVNRELVENFEKRIKR